MIKLKNTWIFPKTFVCGSPFLRRALAWGETCWNRWFSGGPFPQDRCYCSNFFIPYPKMLLFLFTYTCTAKCTSKYTFPYSNAFLSFFPKHLFLGLLFYVVRWPGVRHAGIDGSRGVPATRDDDDVNIPPRLRGKRCVGHSAGGPF